MNYSIVGTVGHVDHGKSSLIKMLNDFWGDTTQEEKRRGITIDLSFSYLKNKDTTLAFIDMPGHENLLSTMISGVYSCDIALVVIDINEGIMPQTKEHLEVLNFLHVKKVVIVLTKIDLAEQTLVAPQRKKIEKYIKKYKNINIHDVCEVSIYDEKSVEHLKKILFNMVDEHSKEKQNNIFRYYIDRVFSIKGIGTVVTGSVLGGEVQKNNRVWSSELAKNINVKNIQVHENDVITAYKGQRAALVLDVSYTSLKRGYLLTHKGYLRGFKQIELFLACIDEKNIPHNSTVFLHVGTLKIQGKLLHAKPQEPFSEGFTTFVSEELLFVVFADRCIVTYENSLIAGGEVVSGVYDPLKKRDKLPLLNFLRARDFKSAYQILSHVHKKGFGLISSYQRFALTHQEAIQWAKTLDNVFLDEEALVVYPDKTFLHVKEIIVRTYTKNPSALISATMLTLRHKWISQALASKALKSLEDENFISEIDGVYAKEGVKKEDLQNTIEHNVYKMIQQGKLAPLAPYNIYDELAIDRKLGDNILKKLTKAKKVVRLAHNLFVDAYALSILMKEFRTLMKQEGFINVQSLKKHYKLSRKYLIAYLEYLDNFDDVKKEGIQRVLV